MNFEISTTELKELRRKSGGLNGLARNDLVVIANGPSKGQRRLEIFTPSGVQASISVDRSLDILCLSYRGQSIGWRSAVDGRLPTGNLEGENGLELMRNFDGFLFTCGLDHHGLPARYSAQDLNYPPRSETVHTLHGRLATAGVTLIGYGIDWTETKSVWAEAKIQQVGVFNETLVLYRRIEFSLENSKIRLLDRVVNEGYRPTRHHLLYHINFGYPLLDKEARLCGKNWDLSDRLDKSQVRPFDDHIEIVETAPSPPGDATISISNAKSDLSCAVSFNSEMLPETSLWQAYQSGVFALGIEPQTSKNANTTNPEVLPPGSSREYALGFDVGPAGGIG